MTVLHKIPAGKIFKTGKMCYIKIVLVTSLIFSVVRGDTEYCTMSATTMSGTESVSQFCSGDLIFWDDFDTINSDIWTVSYSGNRNKKFQFYVTNYTNAVTESTILNIVPRFNKKSEKRAVSNTSDFSILSNPVKGIQLSTVKSISFKYGHLEIMAKFPISNCMKSSIRLIPVNNTYGEWPKSGEIVIAESYGTQTFSLNSTTLIKKKIINSLHWGPNEMLDAHQKTQWQSSTEFDSKYSKYELLWTPYNISIKVNGQDVGTVAPSLNGFWELGQFSDADVQNPWVNGTSMAPFDQEFYIVLDISASETFCSVDGASNLIKETSSFWSNTRNYALSVDYVKVYAL